MTRLIRILASLFVFSVTLISITAQAANYTLWVNGRGGGGVVGNYESFTYWGPANADAGVNKKAVNWDGYNSIASQNDKIRNALDCFCTGDNWCYIATHSAGDLMVGYTLANYGGSARSIKNPTPNAAGQCSNATGVTQAGWNIKWVRAASGAGGGSELSDVGSWTTSEPLVKDLKTTTARAMYDHNNTRNVWFYMHAGAKGTLYSGVLPGQDDEAVAYHSSGGVAGAGGAGFCNPGNWFCNELTMGTALTGGNKAKWSYHSVAFRDTTESYNHYANGSWAGIISVVRAAMAANAR